MIRSEVPRDGYTLPCRSTPRKPTRAKRKTTEGGSPAWLSLNQGRRLERSRPIPLTAARFAQAVRSHWGIENRAHYVRDQGFGEDDSRIRRKPGMVARLRSFALNILRANGIGNVSQALYRNALSLDHLLAYAVT